MSRSIKNPISHAQHSKIMEPSTPCSTSEHVTECQNCGWTAWVEPHNTTTGNNLVKALFDVSSRKGKLHYKTRPKLKKFAETLWWRHGVCVHCNHRSISGGVCLHCGHDYREPEVVKVVKLIRSATEGVWCAALHSPLNYRRSAYEAATLDAFPNGATDVEIPAYKDITERLEFAAYKAVIREKDYVLVAKVNDLEKFTLWAARIAEGGVIDALGLDKDDEADWFNVYCYTPKYRTKNDTDGCPYRHPFIKRVCEKVWKEVQKI